MFSWSLLAANIFVELAQELLAGLINSVGKTSRNNSISFFSLCLESGKFFSLHFPKAAGPRGQSLEHVPQASSRNPTSTPARQPPLGSPTQMWQLLDFLSLLSYQARSWLRLEKTSQGERALGGL